MITVDDIKGMDIAWFGGPFIPLADPTIGDASSLDICHFAEPIAMTWYVSTVTFDATKMFFMF